MAGSDRSNMEVDILPALPEIPGGLVPQPGFSAGLESHLETKGHLRADADPAVDYLGEGLAAHPKNPCRLGHGEAQGLEKLFPQQFSRMGRVVHGAHTITSMVVFVVDDLHILSVKTEGNSPVGLHGDRPDTTPVAMQPMEPEAGYIDIVRSCRNLQPNENAAQFTGMSWLYTCLAPGPVKPLETFVEKTLYHISL